MTEEKTYPPFKRGCQGYALIYRIIKDAPRTSYEISALAGCSQQRAQKIMSQFYGRQLCHIGGWEVANYSFVVKWSGGIGEDAPRPVNMNGQVMSRLAAGKKPNVEMMAFERLMFLLQEAGQTTASLSEETGISIDVVRRLLNYMHDKLDLARVILWDQTIAISPVAIWGLGEGKHANKPRKNTKRENNKRAWAARQTRLDSLEFMHRLAGTYDK